MTSVRTRILLFFTIFAAVSLTAVVLSGRSVRTVGDAADAIAHRHLPMVHALGEMENSLQRQDKSVYRFLNREMSALDDFEKERMNYTRAFVSAQALAVEIESDKLSAIDELYVQYDNQARKVLLTGKSDLVAANKMLSTSEEYLRQIQGLINEIKGIREGMTIVRQEQITQTLSYHRGMVVIFTIVIFGFFLGLAVYLWRFLVQPLSLLLDGIRNFTRGKTDVQIPRIGKDELGELQEAFNEMSRELDVERKRLRSESQSDALTGLFNMRYFRMQLVEEFSRSQRYSRPLTLLMLDVDHFKAYNDRNGHPAGDIVLKEVSRILIRNVRGTDIVARYGGEEFVVLLPETPLDSGLNVAEKVRKAVEDHYFPFAGSKTGERLSVSIGVASYPDVRVTSDQDLVEASDKALYAAKRAGRNRVCASSPQGQVLAAPVATKTAR